MSKIVLGKGLQALIPGESTEETKERRFRSVPLDRISPNPLQPRRTFDQAALAELAESFRRNGVMQPLVLRQDGSSFTIIAGERRFRAARLAGMNEVPAVLMEDVDDGRMLELALIENLQREDLNPLETAEAYRLLLDKIGLTQAQLGERVGKSRAAVTNVLRLLTLPAKIKEMIREGKLSEGHARAILALDDETEMLSLADRIIEGAMSVRETERRTRKPKGRKLIPKRRLPAIAEAESMVRQKLGTAVRINHTLKGGRIEIEYYSDDDLTRLLELFQKIEV
ncbi:MAG TPA: ParB/RepB/Spo0J family partition protein [candidate division Zixibacteria bacterium]|nr:ParB/RepB/Spo0J family partition protein [candidate division Zixibacteria bacterium]